jgi:hypothetical protein
MKSSWFHHEFCIFMGQLAMWLDGGGHFVWVTPLGARFRSVKYSPLMDDSQE